MQIEGGIDMKIRKAFLIAAMLFPFSLASCNIIPSDSSLSESFGYRVRFHTECLLLVPDQRVEEGGKVKEPEIDRPGYTLKGWYCNGVKWDFDKDIVQGDTILVAEWIGKEYSVRLVDEIGPANGHITVTCGKHYTLPQPDVTGYRFSGWWNGEEKVPNMGEWSIPNDVTLTARYQGKTYELTLDTNGGTLPNGTSSKYSVTYGSHFTLPVPTSTFGEFKGWYVEDTKITDSEGNSIAPFTFLPTPKVVASWDNDIYSVADLKALVNNPAGHYALRADLDLSGEEWVPLCDSYENAFSGLFKGNNHTIRGLTMTTPRDYSGLFGRCSGGTIKGVKLTDVNINISGLAGASYIGAVCGYAQGYIRECEVSGSITTTPVSPAYGVHTGGICGYIARENFMLNSGVTLCVNNANISGIRYVGGIVGLAMAKCLACTNNGNITSDLFAGGIIGCSKSEGAERCLNTGNVSSSSHAGGIIGYVEMSSIVQKCKNEGDITAALFGGGIVGEAESGQIWDSANTGNISSSNDGSSTDYVGGIVGHFNSPDINACYNRGDVSGLSNVGGIVGYVKGSTTATISACYSLGTIASASYAGGIVGSSSLCQLSGCYTVIVATGTGSFKGTINGTDATEIDYSTCYYSSSEGCAYLEGNEVPVHYDEDFYVNTMSWRASDWSFSEDDYPTLESESSLIRSE